MVTAILGWLFTEPAGWITGLIAGLMLWLAAPWLFAIVVPAALTAGIIADACA